MGNIVATCSYKLFIIGLVLFHLYPSHIYTHIYTTRMSYRVAIWPRRNLAYIQIYPIRNTIISSNIPSI